MPYVCVDKDQSELIFQYMPIKGIHQEKWLAGLGTNEMVILRSGTIEKLIGRRLNWDNAPIKI